MMAVEAATMVVQGGFRRRCAAGRDPVRQSSALSPSQNMVVAKRDTALTGHPLSDNTLHVHW
jgi:hypothetical protein